jgi:ATP-dependent Lon protease
MKVENEDYTEPMHIEALMRSVRENLEQVISKGKVFLQTFSWFLKIFRIQEDWQTLVASNLNLKVEDAQAVLEVLKPCC